MEKRIIGRSVLLADEPDVTQHGSTSWVGQAWLTKLGQLKFTYVELRVKP